MSAPKHIVLIVDGTCSLHNAHQLDLVRLPHPSAASDADLAEFLQIEGNLLELQRMEQQPSSWLLGSKVCSEQGVYIGTRVDPLLLALPMLHKNRNKTREHSGLFMTAESLLAESPQLAKLQHMDLMRVCDHKMLSESFYRLNDEKVIAWLKAKVERVAAALHQSTEHKPSSKIAAIDIVAEYLSQEWTQRLLLAYGLSESALEALNTVPKHGELISADGDVVRGAPPTKRKAAPASSKSKKLAKIDTKGMRSLRSYFAPKSK